MKTKLFTLFLALVAGVGTIYASNTQVNGIWYNFNSSSKTATVTYRGSSYSSYSDEYTGDVVIPASVSYNNEEYSVTSIGYYAFHDCTGLTSVTIPNSVTSIEYDAFSFCTGLTSVTIPNSVTSIGWCAFCGCTGLTSLSVEAGNTVYDSRNNCNAIIETSTNTLIFGCQNTTIPNSVTSIEGGAFYGCSGLTSVTIPNSVTSIGSSAFSGCSGLTSVTIPNSVTSIGDQAFAWCSGLTSITNYATTPQTIESNVFGGDEYFPGADKSTCVLNVPKESVSLYQAAEVWKDFTNILPIEGTPGTCITASGTCGAEGDNLTWELSCDSILTISGTGEMANYSNASSVPWYSYHSSIQYVVIGNNVTSIGYYAFSYCTGLTSVTIAAETPPTLGSSAFANTSNCPIYVPCGTLDAYKEEWSQYANRIQYQPLVFNYLVNVQVNDETMGSVVLPQTQCEGYTLTAVPNDDYHFTQWSDGNTENPRIFVLTQDTTFIAEFAIDRTGSCGDDNMLTWVYEPESKTLTISGEGVLNSNYTFGLEAPTNIQTLVIQNGVTSVGNSAFANEDKMTSLSLPDGLTAIGDNAFINCKKLTEVTIPASVIEIGESAFRNGNRLETVVLGSGVETIGNNAFANCPYILYVYARMEYPPIIDASVFADCGELSYIDLYVPEDSYARYRKTAVWNSFNIKTIAPTGIGNVKDEKANGECIKILRNGQILILRGDNIYTLTGQEVK